jgi:uncharacterized RDD family membrane protein YckC
MIWIAAGILAFFIYTGARLLRSSGTRSPTAMPGAGVAETPGSGPSQRAAPTVEVALDSDAPEQLVLAGRLRRVAARLIDNVVVAGLGFALAIAASIASGSLSGDNAVSRLRWVGFLSVLVAYCGYEIGFVATSGQTLGKSALRIRVVSLETGEHPGVGGAFARWVVPALAGLVAPVLLSPGYLSGTGGPFAGRARWALYVTLIIYAWALWDPHRQGIHDKIAQTVVVQKAETPS